MGGAAATPGKKGCANSGGWTRTPAPPPQLNSHPLGPNRVCVGVGALPPPQAPPPLPRRPPRSHALTHLDVGDLHVAVGVSLLQGLGPDPGGQRGKEPRGGLGQPRRDLQLVAGVGAAGQQLVQVCRVRWGGEGRGREGAIKERRSQEQKGGAQERGAVARLVVGVGEPL